MNIEIYGKEEKIIERLQSKLADEKGLSRNALLDGMIDLGFSCLNPNKEQSITETSEITLKTAYKLSPRTAEKVKMMKKAQRDGLEITDSELVRWIFSCLTYKFTFNELTELIHRYLKNPS